MIARLGLAAALVIASSVLLVPSAAHADTDDFTFDAFHADYDLSRADDGHAELAVTETIVARFPDEDQNRGIVRLIPDRYDRVPLHTEIVSVTDAAGRDVPYETERRGDDISVATGDDDYVRGVQTYVIAYTQRDSIRSFADTRADEFYRDVNGTGWAQPFGEVTAQLTVDDELRSALTGDAACYLGAQGEDAACPDAPSSTTAASGPLAFGATGVEPEQTLTIAVGFDPGTFVPGQPVLTPIERLGTDGAPALNAIAVAATAGARFTLGGAFTARRRRRSAEGRGVIVPQYTPYPGLSVLQAAHLVGRPAPAPDAAIIDLAVSGHARLLERDDPAQADPAPTDPAPTFALEYLRPAPDDPGRQRVIDAVFGDDPATGTTVPLDGESAELAARITSLSADQRRSLHELGYTQPRPTTAPTVTILAGLITVAAAVFALVVTAAADTVTAAVVAAVPVTVVAGVVAACVVRYGDRVTEAGTPARDHLLGLRDYLVLAETDRIRMLQSPRGAERRDSDDESNSTDITRSTDTTRLDTSRIVHLYERLLPYAVVWGIEREWADAIATHAAETGSDLGWYHGTTPFSSTQLVLAMTAAHTATSGMPPSASGSGSFTGGSMGGGFAGGGAGGGGGGGR